MNQTETKVTLTLDQKAAQRVFDALTIRIDALNDRDNPGDAWVADRYAEDRAALVDAVRAAGGDVLYGKVGLEVEKPYPQNLSDEALDLTIADANRKAKQNPALASTEAFRSVAKQLLDEKEARS
jgi:hypothetical protein